MERGPMFITKREEKETNCYTYEVKMVIQVFAENLEQANARLDENGGYISSREVTLLNSNTVFEAPIKDDDEDSTEEPSETV
jgi:hypothetical protein